MYCRLFSPCPQGLHHRRPANQRFCGRTLPEDAAIAVTTGALDQLSREELQGVIAHEFSHIGNGDTKTTGCALRPCWRAYIGFSMWLPGLWICLKGVAIAILPALVEEVLHRVPQEAQEAQVEWVFSLWWF